MTNQPPAQVMGAMDGEMVPTGKVEEIMKNYITPFREKYASSVEMKPWAGFLKITPKIPESSEMMANVDKNLKFYKFNYAAIAVGFLLFTIITTPWCLGVVLIMAAAWGAFLKKNEDPEWVVVVGGVTVDKYKRTLSMSALTILSVIIFIGSTITYVLVSTSFLSILHAVFHRQPVSDAYDVVDEDLEV